MSIAALRRVVLDVDVAIEYINAAPPADIDAITGAGRVVRPAGTDVRILDGDIGGICNVHTIAASSADL